MKKHYRKDNVCLNCNSLVTGKYCSNCGQENLELKESFWHLLSHTVGHYFHFDSKFNQTIVPLLTKPGVLTLDYNSGKRARHLHPVSMYMFISLVFFLILFKTHENTKVGVAPASEQLRAKNEEKHTDKSQVVEKIAADMEKDSLLGPPRKRMISSAVNELKTVEDYEALQASLPAAKQDNWFMQLVWKKYLRSQTDKNWGESVLEAFRHSIPKIMFVMLPLYALILQIFFRRSKLYYMEHLIHSIHLHCFLFLFWSLLLIIGFIPGVTYIDDYLEITAIGFIAWYFFKSLKKVYGRSTRRTISKMAGLMFFYGVSLLLVFAIGFVFVVVLS